MAPVIYLDTHVVAWLFAGMVELIPVRVRQRLDTEDLFISPMVGLELQYLHETRRTGQPAAVVLGELAEAIGLRTCDLPFARVIETAVAQAWTRDPFDRIIVGHAALRQAALVTKDRVIHRHYSRAMWAR
jgi:PIN domain nuclease of toxin-antitoxin system